MSRVAIPACINRADVAGSPGVLFQTRLKEARPEFEGQSCLRGDGFTANVVASLD